MNRALKKEFTIWRLKSNARARKSLELIFIIFCWGDHAEYSSSIISDKKGQCQYTDFRDFLSYKLRLKRHFVQVGEVIYFYEKSVQ